MKNNLQELCKLIRYDILTSTTAAGSGHPSSALSATELMATLFFGEHFHYDLENPQNIFNDRIIFSKGHASPLYYSLFHVAGVVSDEALQTLRKFDSNLEGHPTPRFKYADVSTGSLGQGLSIGVGMALGIKLHLRSQMSDVRSREPHVFVLLGDSEMAEGQVWEAMELASHYKLNNLVAILDVNRLGQRGETMLGWNLEVYKNRAESFGWDVIVVEDGHDLDEVNHAFANALTPRVSPVMIIAKTKKGKGVSALEDKDNWHGKSLPKDKLDEALKEIGEVDKTLKGAVRHPELVLSSDIRRDASGSSKTYGKMLNQVQHDNQLPSPNYKQGDLVATREAYGMALADLGKTNDRIVVLDAEVSNSTFADQFQKAFPDRFFEMYIAEQNMISVALGLSKLGFIPYTSTFAAFLTRAFDQIRMIQYSEGNVKVAGSHAGVSIGYDGSSQMGLEDLAMFRSLLESTVFYPSDAVSTYHLVSQAMDAHGVVYIRTTREKTPVLYDANIKFAAGGSQVLKQSDTDIAVVFAAGITLHEALKAYELLQKEGINIAIVDLYSVKPIDVKTIQQFSNKTKNVIVVEDHYPYGGLGEAVLSALSKLKIENLKFTHLCVQKIPHSGSPEELLRFEEIDAEAIVKAVKNLR
jgi:transketolase